MNETFTKKFCQFALFSIISITISIICFSLLFIIPVYLRGAQPYKIIYFISKSFFVLFSFVSVVLGHIARYKIKKIPQRLFGKVLATISLVLGYFFLVLVSAYLILLTQLRISGNPKATTKSIICSLEMALTQYKNDVASFPSGSSKDVVNAITGFRSSPDKLDDMYKNDPKWLGPYWIGSAIKFKNSKKNQELLDLWKKPYNFSFKNNEIFIWSCGPNRKNENGKGDDITN